MRSANENRKRILLNGIPFNAIPFPFISIKKMLKVLFPFVSIKTNFESSVKLLLLLVALCFRVNPKEVTQTVEFR